ncbi:unnamed protein product [Dibothriocephalus latus]|uniref:PH domain-containing protein n=1 Tax=Dibothriocephalus latus TaxID=60516 RepID=A0A3P7ME79_DIBLA|nr:unnamed protein product [Dibothriocephalus latus]
MGLVAAAKAELATETGGLLSTSLPTLNKFRMSGTAKTPRRAEMSGLPGASGVYRLPRYFFNVVKEGDALIFAVPDEAELHGWVQVIHRATGQSHKPVPPVRVSSSRGHFRKDGMCFFLASILLIGQKLTDRRTRAIYAAASPVRVFLCGRM